jgi:hypothetical protein
MRLAVKRQLGGELTDERNEQDSDHETVGQGEARDLLGLP